MKIPFSKYHANGNDFIIISSHDLDNKSLNNTLIARLCRRHKGIGADGLFVVSASKKYDFVIDYYNSDGSWETFCANGSRCAVKFNNDILNYNNGLRFKTGASIHSFKINSSGLISMSMKIPIYKSDCISLLGFEGFFVDSGARHFVCQSENLNDGFVLNTGRKIRNSPEFHPRGINVNFYRYIDSNSVEIKTYEKGVEQVMLSCASGSAAVVFHLSQINAITSPVITCSNGGKLVFTFDDDWAKFWSQGPAEFIFNGEFDMAVLN